VLFFKRSFRAGERIPSLNANLRLALRELRFLARKQHYQTAGAAGVWSGVLSRGLHQTRDDLFEAAVTRTDT